MHLFGFYIRMLYFRRSGYGWIAGSKQRIFHGRIQAGRAPFVAPSLPGPSLPTPPGSQVVEGMDVAWAPDAVSAFEWRVCQAFEVTDSGLQTPILEAFRRS